MRSSDSGSSPVVLGTFPSEAAALVAKAVLDANNIASIVSGDGASAMEPQLQYVQGVRLLVRSDQVALARELLAE